MQRFKKRKDGFFFITDTILAIIIIFAGLAIVLSSSTTTPITAQAALTAHDFLKQLSATQINASNDEVIIAARFNRTISTADNYRSVLETLVYLCSRNLNYTATEIVSSISQSTLPTNYNVEFRINNTLVYNRSVNTVTAAQAPFVLKDRKIVYGLTNASTAFGPYIVEFAIWT